MYYYPITVLRSILSSEDPPTKVVPCKPDAYSERDICHREDGMVLYAPHTSNSKKEKPRFEIVLHKPLTESQQTYR